MCMFYSVYSQLALSHVPKWFACVDSGEVELYQFYNCNPRVRIMFFRIAWQNSNVSDFDRKLRKILCGCVRYTVSQKWTPPMINTPIPNIN